MQSPSHFHSISSWTTCSEHPRRSSFADLLPQDQEENKRPSRSSSEGSDLLGCSYKSQKTQRCKAHSYSSFEEDQAASSSTSRVMTKRRAARLKQYTPPSQWKKLCTRDWSRGESIAMAEESERWPSRNAMLDAHTALEESILAIMVTR